MTDPPGAIDAHVHVWSDDEQRYPMAGDADRSLLDVPRFVAADVLGMIQPHGLERAVLVQMPVYGEDHRLLTDIIAGQPDRFRGVGELDPHAHQAAQLTQRMIDLASQGMRGFRVRQLDPVDDAWLNAPGLQAMLRCAAERGLAICPLIDPAALASLDRACAAFPETTVVIDHFARLGARRPMAESDVAALLALARHPRVFVKLSGFWGLAPAPYDDLAPLIERLVEAFGADRLMWASDGPYGMTRGRYDQAVGLVRERMASLDPRQRRVIFGESAARVFFGEP